MSDGLRSISVETDSWGPSLGDILHKDRAIRLLIRAAGAKLFFLPRCSPDINPIEQVFIPPDQVQDTWMPAQGRV